MIRDICALAVFYASVRGGGSACKHRCVEIKLKCITDFVISAVFPASRSWFGLILKGKTYPVF